MFARLPKLASVKLPDLESVVDPNRMPTWVLGVDTYPFPIDIRGADRKAFPILLPVSTTRSLL